MRAPSRKGTVRDKSLSASVGVGNKGASRQVCIGYITASSANGSSQTQAGTSPISPDAASDSGKPQAMKMRRQRVSPRRLALMPTAAASNSATVDDIANQRVATMNTHHEAAQAMSAGAGQGILTPMVGNVNRCITKSSRGGTTASAPCLRPTQKWKASLSPPQCLPFTMIGAEASFITTNLP